MQVIIQGATIARYGQYGNADQPLKYERGEHAGKVIEYVDVLVSNASGESEMRTLTLAPHINGSRPAAGSTVDVLARVIPHQEVVFRRDGSERIATRDKWRALDFAEVKADTGKAA